MIDELRQAGEIGVEWTPKQVLFAAAYLRHRVGSRAVREAGYDVIDKPDRAAEIAKALLKVGHVRKHIAERSQELLSRYKAEAEHVIAELATIAFLNIGDMVRPDADGGAVVDLRDLSDRQWKAIVAIDVEEKTTIDATTGNPVTIKNTKLKPMDKLKALEALGRHHRLFTDKLEVSGSVDIASRIKAARDAMRAKREEANGDDGTRGAE